jgi:predicted ABC-type ATPase
MSGQPWLWLLAGPNGAGKSTYARDLLADVEEIVGPDELAYRISKDAPKSAALQAGRLAVRRRNELLEQRRTFAIETTLSGRRHFQLVERARSEGWSIGVVYIGLGSPDLAIQRVRERVSQHGHNVPAADIRRRYRRGLSNLAIVYELADRLVVLDNSSVRKRIKRVLEVSRGSVVFRQRRLPKWLSAALRTKRRGRSKKTD